MTKKKKKKKRNRRITTNKQTNIYKNANEIKKYFIDNTLNQFSIVNNRFSKYICDNRKYLEKEKKKTIKTTHVCFSQ